MQIVYNGIDMSVMQDTWHYVMESVYDDTQTDYLFTKHSLVCRTVVNGQADVFRGNIVNGQWFRNGPAVTYAYAGAAIGQSQFVPSTVRNSAVSDPIRPVYRSGVPTVPPGTGFVNAPRESLIEVVSRPNHPSFTLQAIRQRLSDPRGQLYVMTPQSEGPNNIGPTSVLLPVMLESPEPGMVCDCKNGPFPKVLSVDQVYGNDMTFMVTFALETYVNESNKNGVRTAGLLLSNRFMQTASIDERSFTTLTTEGQAVFRTDYLYYYGVTPDHIRAELMLKIPQGFKRDNINVTALPDVTGVRYAFADRQLPVSFAAGPFAKAQKIVAVHRQAIINNKDILQGALASYERVLGIAANNNIAKPGLPRARVITPPTDPPATT